MSNRNLRSKEASIHKQDMSHPITCMKCRKVTETQNASGIVTANGRYRMHGQCIHCGTNKSKFVSRQHAEGILGNLFGLPGGKIPILSDIPLVGALF